MMVLKQAGRSICRVGDEGAQHGQKQTQITVGAAGGPLDGTIISTSDVDFVINGNMINVVETTIGRRYAGWFIRNGEYAQRVLEGLQASALPAPGATGMAKGGGRGYAPADGQTKHWGREDKKRGNKGGN